MAAFTKEELLKIAHLSALKLEESEIALFTNQLTQVLAYVEQLQKVSIAHQQEMQSIPNVLRDDIAQPSHPEDVLALAPQQNEHCFVVPTILEEK